MAFKCESCGWRDVEVKGGGEVPEKGSLLELHYDPSVPGARERDFGRDLIKGDSASVDIPEIGLAVAQGSLGGLYTTLEGLLGTVRDRLLESNPFMLSGGGSRSISASGSSSSNSGARDGDGEDEAGDSTEAGRRDAMLLFGDKLRAVADGGVPFTLIMRDPMGGSWIYSPYQDEMPPRDDPVLKISQYERSAEENSQLGLDDMKTEGYGEEEATTQPAAEGKSAADASTTS